MIYGLALDATKLTENDHFFGPFERCEEKNMRIKSYGRLVSVFWQKFYKWDFRSNNSVLTVRIEDGVCVYMYIFFLYSRSVLHWVEVGMGVSHHGFHDPLSRRIQF